MRDVASTALGILERPPFADAFFDNQGPESNGLFLANYKTQTVSVFDLNDGGERMQANPPFRFDEQIHLPKW